MRCGLFGKLPAKRDFIAISVPRAFLRLWEPWLETGLAAGRAGAAGRDWDAAYHSAPIWRFWLGPALCGEALAGAFMPSVDALGRMFPLTVVGAASGAEPLPPPDADSRDPWFARVEAFLLDALEPATPFEAIAAGLDGLAAQDPAPSADPRARMFAALRSDHPDGPAEAATFWWTIGGADCPPFAIVRQGMPAPAAFAEMLTRRESRPDPEQQSPPQPAAQAG
jgi:type VI secretion system protein ImpM